MAETDTHADLLIDLKLALKQFFFNQDDVYVTGNIMFYYVEGEPSKVTSPDVMVCFGIPKGDRRSYKVWEENDVVPSVVIELSSVGTWRKDIGEKRDLYARLGVNEYFIFSPLDLKSKSYFIALRLEDGSYDEMEIIDGRVRSEILGLDLVASGKTLRLFNPQTNEFLKTTAEFAEENRAVIDENLRLKSELERLKKLLNEN